MVSRTEYIDLLDNFVSPPHNSNLLHPSHRRRIRTTKNCKGNNLSWFDFRRIETTKPFS
ncbi:hypothetical protein PILCRDRAFT_824882 [Piloderma croceum F 1598]|uniref:Uncharacterized protein n=1 Tax=Piloderma croceum (strain F 1598) TaxID=765440 RepID=A0A0C3FDF0_PILCF|nr:hypothetical protein PILCRDRAFT_824882 [Piloderma croceum F 1598]